MADLARDVDEKILKGLSSLQEKCERQQTREQLLCS